MRGRLIGILLVILGMWWPAQTAQATANDWKNAMAKAPQGVRLENIFVKGTTPNNHAAVHRGTNAETPDTDVVTVTNDKGQFGAIWSTDENAFDLNKDAQVSMWMYFGQDLAKAADGMALVLQNDDRGIQASPTFTAETAGETLGVWGVDRDQWQNSPVAIAKSAIQNSWALEFDTHSNTGGNPGMADSFDRDLGTQARNVPHIGANYPGDAGTYYIRSPYLGLSGRFYTVMKHTGVIQGYRYTNDLLSDGAWHHVTLKWNARTHQVTYWFDDKDPDTGSHNDTNVVRTASVTLDPEKVDPHHTGKVRWGFTGATGDQGGNNLVVFEGVPGLVSADAAATLTNRETGQTVDNGGNLVSQTPVELTYQLNYRGGKQVWRDIEAQLTLPKLVDWTKADITYNDGTPATTIDLTGLSGNALTYHLKKVLRDGTPNQATLRFEGRTQDVTTATDAINQRSVFKAANGVATTRTPAFKVHPQLDLQLTTDATRYQVRRDEDPYITGQVRAGKGSLKDVKLTLVTRVNGQRIGDTPVGADGRVRYTLANRVLKAGTNQVTLQVQDGFGNQSEPITVTVDVTGGLSFATVAPQSSFKTTTLTGKSQRIGRENDWRVRVQDTRKLGERWSLQVSATPFKTAGGQRLAGELVFREANRTQPITEQPLTIQRGSAGKEAVIDAIAGWNQDQGLELAVNGSAESGVYRGEITWTLADVPN